MRDSTSRARRAQAGPSPYEQPRTASPAGSEHDVVERTLIGPGVRRQETAGAKRANRDGENQPFMGPHAEQQRREKSTALMAPVMPINS